MTRICLKSIVFLIAFSSVAAVHARPRPSRMSSKFEANKTFGLGIILGAPTGLSGKYYFGKSLALDFAAGGYRDYFYDDALQVHVDVLWHPLVIVTASAFWIPLYAGVGARILDHRYRFRDDERDNDLHLGVRAPIGLALNFNHIPLDVFAELALIVDIVSDHGHSFIDGGLGVRYYF